MMFSAQQPTGDADFADFQSAPAKNPNQWVHVVYVYFERE